MRKFVYPNNREVNVNEQKEKQINSSEMNLDELKSLITTFLLLSTLSDYHHLLSVFLQGLKDIAIQGT